MKVLVVGHGAREHAIAKKLAQEDLELVAAMSRLNPGIAALSERVEVFDINDPAEYERFRDVDLAFVGPEAPLAMGVSDRLWELGVPVVGARKALARLEWSKAWHYQQPDCLRCAWVDRCRERLVAEAEERDVSLSSEERRLPPSELAHRIFSSIIPGLDE